jgi:hypothetical protein
MRRYRLPARYRDLLPEGPSSINIPQICPSDSASRRTRVILHVKDNLRTDPNNFGLIREYPYRPSYDPDHFVPLDDLSNFPCQNEDSVTIHDTLSHSNISPPWPFPNMSVYRMVAWMNTGSSMKTAKEVDRLVHDVILQPDFNSDDLKMFRAQKANVKFDQSELVNNTRIFEKDQWRSVDVDITIPLGVKNSTGKGHTFTVQDLHYRPLVDIITAAFSEPTALKFHFSPFKYLVKNTDGIDLRVYGEAFTSDAHIKAHNDLQKQPPEPGCTLERTIALLMFFSDATHLSVFGTAKAWPVYLYFGNLSKYHRAKPGSGACHYVAFIPSVSTCINQGCPPSSPTKLY